MNRFRFVVLLASLCLAAPQQVIAKSVEKEFTEAWTERGDRYAREKDQAAADLKAAFDALSAADAKDRTKAEEGLTAVFRQSYAIGYSAAREQTVRTLLQFMAGKPSAARTELWIEDQADQLRQRSEKAKARSENASKMVIGQNGLTAFDYVKESGAAIFDIGAAQGIADELQSIDSNLTSYFRAKGEQEARRKAMWAAIGQSLKEASQQQNKGWSMSCSTIGQFTNCNGD